MKIFTRSGLFARVAATIRNDSSAKARHNRPFTARPCIEVLEDRLVPATFMVNTLADTVDADPAMTSLREAITDANTQAGDDIINFSVTGTINLTGALPDLSSNIEIQGPGAASLTVRRITGSGDYRVFTVVGDPTVMLDGLTISNGVSSNGGGIYNGGGTVTLSNCTLWGNSAFDYGGGVYNGGGTLAVSNCLLFGNSASNRLGGGIYNYGGTVTVSNSTLYGNSAYWGGGGIMNETYGTLTVSSTTLTSNSGDYGVSGGGGIFNFGTLTVSNTTLDSNSALFGGGIYNGGTLTVSNSTLSGNSAIYIGGGIYNGGTLTVSNSTLSDNHAEGGGGIYNDYSVTLNNTIVANSTSGGDVDNGGALTGSQNLIEDGSDGLSDTITGDPNLGPLANNGGPTLTHALLTGSPAIDAGANTLAIDPTTGLPLTTDQRGLPYTRINGGRVDIGAFESPGPAIIGPDPCDPSHTALFVMGTAGNDTIIINPAQQGVTVRINGTDLGTFQPTGRLIVYGQAGNDDIQVSGSINLSVWLYGDGGDDRLKGGAGDDVLLGGDGADLLTGSQGRDLLIGGTGADRIVGNADDDILIAASTDFDSNDAALCSILAEWTSARSYAVRVQNLRDGAGSVTRLNGIVFLTDQTVHDDGVADILTGSAGQDWFLLNQDGDNNAAKDKTTDLLASEFASDLDFINGP